MNNQPYSTQYMNIEELRQKRKSALKTKQQASEVFERKDQNLQQRTTALATLTKEHILMSRQLKDVDIEIFELKMRLADIEEGSDYIAEQLEKLVSQRRKLKQTMKKTEDRSYR